MILRNFSLGSNFEYSEVVSRFPNSPDTWGDTGITVMSRDSGVVEFFKHRDHNCDLLRFEVCIYDASVPEFEAQEHRIILFWRLYLGYAEKELTRITFQS